MYTLSLSFHSYGLRLSPCFHSAFLLFLPPFLSSFFPFVLFFFFSFSPPISLLCQFKWKVAVLTTELDRNKNTYIQKETLMMNLISKNKKSSIPGKKVCVCDKNLVLPVCRFIQKCISVSINILLELLLIWGTNCVIT